jgi:hypothetical protein
MQIIKKALMTNKWKKVHFQLVLEAGCNPSYFSLHKNQYQIIQSSNHYRQAWLTDKIFTEALG